MTQAAFELVAKCSGKLGSVRYSVKPPPEFPVSRIASIVTRSYFKDAKFLPSHALPSPLLLLAHSFSFLLLWQENGEAGACLKLL